MKRDAVVKAMVPSETKAKALKVLDYWGISLTDAINLYMVKIIECGGIPFEMQSYKVNLDNPNLIHAETSEDGSLVVPGEWLDDDD